MSGHVYTVGFRKNYDKGLVEYGDKFLKKGAEGDYPGGFAVRTAEDGQRLIDERPELGEGYAVYELDADWDKDTGPSEHGWWHGLKRDARILRRVTPLPLAKMHEMMRLSPIVAPPEAPLRLEVESYEGTDHLRIEVSACGCSAFLMSRPGVHELTTVCLLAMLEEAIMKSQIS